MTKDALQPSPDFSAGSMIKLGPELFPAGAIGQDFILPLAGRQRPISVLDTNVDRFFPFAQRRQPLSFFAALHARNITSLGAFLSHQSAELEHIADNVDPKSAKRAVKYMEGNIAGYLAGYLRLPYQILLNEIFGLDFSLRDGFDQEPMNRQPILPADREDEIRQLVQREIMPSLSPEMQRLTTQRYKLDTYENAEHPLSYRELAKGGKRYFSYIERDFRGKFEELISQKGEKLWPYVAFPEGSLGRAMGEVNMGELLRDYPVLDGPEPIFDELTRERLKPLLERLTSENVTALTNPSLFERRLKYNPGFIDLYSANFNPSEHEQLIAAVKNAQRAFRRSGSRLQPATFTPQRFRSQPKTGF